MAVKMLTESLKQDVVVSNDLQSADHMVALQLLTILLALVTVMALSLIHI